MQLSATVSIPVVIAVGGILFNASQNERNKQVEQRRGQDEALQGYLGEMSDLLADEDFSAYLQTVATAAPSQPNQEVDLQRTVAQARTLTLLRRIGPEEEGGRQMQTEHEEKDRPGVRLEAQQLGSAERKGRVLEFLYKAKLIMDEKSIISLGEADLEDVSLPGADLSKASLEGAYLRHANFGPRGERTTRLSSANLGNANLTLAFMPAADLSSANLRDADLDGTNLRGATMTNAEFDNDTYLTGANLAGADLSGATGLTTDKISRTIESGATKLPDGVKPPERWNLPLLER